MVKRKQTREEMKRRHEPDYVIARKEALPVSDNWYPTTNGVVNLTMYLYKDGHCRLTVWGGDDFGMELMSDIGESEARATIDLLVGGGVLTQKDFRGLGFIPV